MNMRLSPTILFYDLETSSLSTVGQILNYSFVETDFDFNILSECSGGIKIKPTELIHPQSALVTNFNLGEHLRLATHTEFEAMNRIHQYLTNLCEKTSKIYMMGFNTNVFDLKFLRTSLIRNGLFPYFNQTILYRDLLHIISHKCIKNEFNFDKKKKFSLSNIYNDIMPVNMVQSHDSRGDVMMMIDMVKHCFYQKNSKLKLNTSDIISSTYQADDLYKSRNKNIVVTRLIPFWQSKYSYKQSNLQTLALLSENRNYSLWIDMEKYLDGNRTKDSLVYFNKKMSPFFVSPQTPTLGDSLVDNAKSHFSNITIDNYFEVPTCDIESYIYKIPPDQISILYEAIHNRDLTRINTKFAGKDLKTIYMRFLINNRNFNAPCIKDAFVKYCKYRYNGEMLIERYKGNDKSDYPNHPNYFQILDDLISKDPSNSVLNSLKKMYNNSQVYKVLFGE